MPKYFVYIALFFFMATMSFVAVNEVDFISYKNVKTYHLQDHKTKLLRDVLPVNQVFVMVFHSVNCPFNAANQAKIQDMITQYQTTDSLTFVYVNSNVFECGMDKPNPSIEAFLKSCSCPYLLDGKRVIKDLFGVQKNGTILVCKQEENKAIKVYYQGPFDDSPLSKTSHENYLKLVLEQAKKDKMVDFEPVVTGCRILEH
jgi:hypothetical protein